MCWSFSVVGWSGIRVAGFSLQHGYHSNQPHWNSNTHRTKKNTTNVVIQQNSRKLLMMDILMSETCWAHKKWNKIASDIKLVFYSSTITMMHGPINTTLSVIRFSIYLFTLFIYSGTKERHGNPQWGKSRVSQLTFGAGTSRTWIKMSILESSCLVRQTGDVRLDYLLKTFKLHIINCDDDDDDDGDDNDKRWVEWIEETPRPCGIHRLQSGPEEVVCQSTSVLPRQSQSILRTVSSV